MIKVTKVEDKNKLVDQSEALVQAHGEGMLKAVQAAMSSGLEHFTTPTPDPDEARIDWRVRKWVSAIDGEPVAFLVAFKEDNAHFEVIGPAIPLLAQAAAPQPELVTRAAPVAAAPTRRQPAAKTNDPSR